MTRLLFASRRPPVPLESGARIRTHRLLLGLSEAFETTFLTFEHAAGTADGHTSPDEVRRALPNVEVVTVPGMGGSKRIGQARSILSGRSWTAGRYRLPAFRQALDAVVGQKSPVIVHFDDLGVAQFGPVDAALNVFAPADIEHRIACDQRRSALSGLRGAYSALECHKLRREERRVVRGATLCLAVSPVDGLAMGVMGAVRVELCPNGTDRVPRLPVPHRPADEPLQLLFVGAGDYGPNERGVAWFVREVLPRLADRMPVRLDVVGRRPRRYQVAPGVAYAGPVESLQPWYERCHAVIVPIFEGSGTRMKVIEAMAYGRPVVSTPLGAEGLPVEAGVHFHRASDANAFAEVLVRLAGELGGPDPRVLQMLDAAREAVAPLFWDSIVRDLVQLYEQGCDRIARLRAT